MSRRILFITEAYPPALTAGALSVGKLVHALVSAGHQVTVLARPRDPDGREDLDSSSCWSALRNPVVRPAEPVGTARILTGGVARLWGRLPAIGGWIYRAYRAARTLVAREQFDCVITGYMPFRTALIGEALKREFGIPWVIRFPDPSPWCLFPAPYGPGRPLTLRDRYMVRRVRAALRYADALIAPSARMAAYIDRVYDGVFARRYIVLPHIGWTRPGNGRGPKAGVHLLHAGIMSRERDSDRIAAMLRTTLQKVRDLGLDVRLTFTGATPGDKNIPEQLRELRRHFDWAPPVGYEESLARMSEATALLLVEAVMGEGIYLPSKLADYAVSGRPVLMFSPDEGTVADLVGGRKHPGFLTQDPDLASARLVEFIRKAAGGEDVASYRFPDPARFSPERVVRALDDGLQRYAPGTAAARPRSLSGGH